MGIGWFVAITLLVYQDKAMECYGLVLDDLLDFFLEPGGFYPHLMYTPILYIVPKLMTHLFPAPCPLAVYFLLVYPLADIAVPSFFSADALGHIASVSLAEARS